MAQDQEPLFLQKQGCQHWAAPKDAQGPRGGSCRWPSECWVAREERRPLPGFSSGTLSVLPGKALGSWSKSLFIWATQAWRLASGRGWLPLGSCGEMALQKQQPRPEGCRGTRIRRGVCIVWQLCFQIRCPFVPVSQKAGTTLHKGVLIRGWRVYSVCKPRVTR